MASVLVIAALVFGMVAISVYAWVVGRWLDSAPQIYLWFRDGAEDAARHQAAGRGSG